MISAICWFCIPVCSTPTTVMRNLSLTSCDADPTWDEATWISIVTEAPGATLHMLGRTRYLSGEVVLIWKKKNVDLNLSVGFDYVQNRYNALLITT